MLYLGIFIFILFIIFESIYILLPLRKENTYKDYSKSKHTSSFGILVPTYEEEKTIIKCIESILKLDYKNYNIYIINDGSIDSTKEVLSDFLNMVPIEMEVSNCLEYHTILSTYQSIKYPNVYVIDKINGGKADALNAGICCCTEEYIVTLDADCTVKSDCISIMNNVLIDKTIVAAGGTVHIKQSTDRSKLINHMKFNINNVIMFQTMHYMVSFYLHKYTQSKLKALVVISGAFGVFKREALLAVNGFRKSVGEDMDITLKIHKHIKRNDSLKIKYIPESVCFTECPEDIKNLTKQRMRWQKAFVDCLRIYWFGFFSKFNPSISIFFVFDSFILGTLTAFLLIMIPIYFIIYSKISIILLVFFLIALIVGVIETLVSIKIAKRYYYSFGNMDLLRTVLFVFLEQLTYRFLNPFYAVCGTILYILNNNSWAKVERLGR